MMIKFLFGLRLFVLSIVGVTAVSGFPHDENGIVKLVSGALIVALADSSNVGRKQIVAQKKDDELQ